MVIVHTVGASPYFSTNLTATAGTDLVCAVHKPLARRATSRGMDPADALPEGWEVWNEEPGARIVLAYRPDVFDSEAFDPACLPTITVAPGSSPDRPPTHHSRTRGWHVVLYAEPDVRLAASGGFEDREAAVSGAIDVAARFVDGEIDYRDAYHDPREAYLDRLDALTGGA